MQGTTIGAHPLALTPRQQLTYWGVAALVLVLALWLLGDVLLPFVIGGAIAYFLDPVADWLERRGLSRTLSVVIITAVAALAFALAVLLVIPTLVAQATALVQQAPELLRELEGRITVAFPGLAELEPALQRSLRGAGELIRERGGALIAGVVDSALGFLGVVVFLLIVPVVAFYLLLDWDRMVAAVDALLPREHAPTIRRLAAEVDETLAGFLRGQGTVMLILGVYYAGALMVAGLTFGLFVGFLAGLISFIPYVGAIVGGGLAIGLALFQFWGEWGMIAVVAAIFFSGQMLEGNVLTPKLVGGSVGLHPVWLLLALSAFGALFGFVGLLVAVPLAAMLGVIARFGIERYRASTLYHGTEEPLPADPPAPAPVAAPPPPASSRRAS